jgi:hypothetical protein
MYIVTAFKPGKRKIGKKSETWGYANDLTVGIGSPLLHQGSPEVATWSYDDGLTVDTAP